MFYMDNYTFLLRSNGKHGICILWDTQIGTPCYDRHLHVVHEILQLVRRDLGMGESVDKSTEHIPFQLQCDKENHFAGNMAPYFYGTLKDKL